MQQPLLEARHLGGTLVPDSWVRAADTRDVAGTVEQVKRCVDAGAEIVRITVQGKKEAAACMDIREALFKDGWAPPPLLTTWSPLNHV